MFRPKMIRNQASEWWQEPFDFGVRFWTSKCSKIVPKFTPKSTKNRSKNQKSSFCWASWGSSGAFRDPQVPRGSLRSQFWTSRSPPGINFGAPGTNFRPSRTHFGAPRRNFPAFRSRSRLQKNCKQRCIRIHSHAFIPQSPHCIAKSLQNN